MIGYNIDLLCYKATSSSDNNNIKINFDLDFNNKSSTFKKITMEITNNSARISQVTFATQSKCEPIQSLSSGSKKISKTPISKQNESPKKAQQCRTRTQWTHQEDVKLLQLFEQLGERWTQIGKTIGGKTGKQVRDRYLYALKPDIVKSKWTPEEDALILSLYQQFGSNWKQIATYLPGRIGSHIKNRYNWSLIKKPAASLESTAQASPNCDASSSVMELSNNIDSFEQSCQKILAMSPSLEFEGSESWFLDFGDEWNLNRNASCDLLKF